MQSAPVQVAGPALSALVSVEVLLTLCSLDCLQGLVINAASAGKERWTHLLSPASRACRRPVSALGPALQGLPTARSLQACKLQSPCSCRPPSRAPTPFTKFARRTGCLAGGPTAPPASSSALQTPGGGLDRTVDAASAPTHRSTLPAAGGACALWATHACLACARTPRCRAGACSRHAPSPRTMRASTASRGHRHLAACRHVGQFWGRRQRPTATCSSPLERYPALLPHPLPPAAGLQRARR